MLPPVNVNQCGNSWRHPALIPVLPFLLTLLLTGYFPRTANCLTQGADPSPAHTAERLQQVYESVHSLSADFSQVTILNMSRRLRRGSGTLLFKKPGFMRWDYRTPERQILISDGDTLTMYFADNKQMLITSAREYLQSDVTYAFFAGTGDINRDFKVLPPDIGAETEEEREAAVKLIPRTPHPQVSEIHVWAAPDTFLIIRLRIVDHFGTITELFFENFTINPEIEAGRFHFDPPAGTEIIRQ